MSNTTNPYYVQSESGTSNTPTKPAWVTALEYAEEALKTASSMSSPDSVARYLGIAEGWRRIAELYKG